MAIILMSVLHVAGGSSPISRDLADTEDPSSSPNCSPVSGLDGCRVFGSLTIDRNSSTPYTDATQVRGYSLNTSDGPCTRIKLGVLFFCGSLLSLATCES